jgi:hypothetical protein
MVNALKDEGKGRQEKIEKPVNESRIKTEMP